MTPLARDWWMHLVRGVAAVVFGVFTILLPGIGLLTLVMLWGVFTLADGATQLISFFQIAGPGNKRRWGTLAGGLLSVAAGLIAVAVPGITAIALLYMIAAWALLNGAITLAAAVQLRKVIHNEWVLALAGVVSIVFALLLAFFPGPGALAVTLWIGAFAVVSGVLNIALGIRMRRTARKQERSASFGASPVGA